MMNDLQKTELFSLLADASKVTNQEMGNAYGCFMKKVEDISQSESDNSEIYRILNNTRIELAFIELLYRYEQGEKYPKIRLS